MTRGSATAALPPGAAGRDPRSPCDGAAPAGPVVRRPVKRLWWIRVPWRIRLHPRRWALCQKNSYGEMVVPSTATRSTR